jgi:CheY-like chemotaxis protein
MGARFEIFLPAIKNGLDIDTSYFPETLPGGNERILVVDDEEPLCELMEKMLTRLGYRVTALSRSVEALELFNSGPMAFDLVLTDMAMPGMTGDRLAEAIRKIRQDIPIIVCTGFSDRIKQESASDIGIRKILTKPVTLSDMATAVRTELDMPQPGP